MESDRWSPALPSLQTIFDAAKAFGLTDEEAWRTLDESLHEVGADASAPEVHDELCATMARRILVKEQQRILAEERSARSKRRRIFSK